MTETLVIILSETRASKLTFEGFKKNVIDELNADLCVCIGVKPDYDYHNEFYKLAKYKFTYDEPDDYGDALDYAYHILSQDRQEYEYFDNIEKKPVYWREFAHSNFCNHLFGGVKGGSATASHFCGSVGILLFFRWFLLKNLIDNDLIEKYDRFIITRSDFIYQLPHPKLHLMEKKHIWIPNGEQYGGYTDRHAILAKDNIAFMRSGIAVNDFKILTDGTTFKKRTIFSRRPMLVECCVARSS